jgi:hypothetical protein
MMVKEDIDELLKAFVIIDNLTDDLNARSDDLYGTGAIWTEIHDLLEKHLGEDFYSDLNNILKSRNLK